MTSIGDIINNLEKNYDSVKYKKLCLKIHHKNVSIDDTKFIMSKLKIFNSVKAISFQAVYMDSESLNYILDQLHNTGIQAMNLTNTKLKNDFVILLATKIQETSITSVNISYNKIESSAMIFLFRALNDCGLRELIIDGNKMDENAGYELAKVLNSGMTILEHLSIEKNEFGKSLHSLINSLQNSRIQKLNLSGIKMKSSDMFVLCNILSSTQIEHLNLSNNKPGKKSILNLSKSMNNSKLIVLILDSCGVGDFEFLRIMESLDKNTRLKKLSFSNNSGITNNSFDYALKYGTRHISLKYMNLYETGMSGTKSKDIMDKMKVNRSWKTNVLLVLSSTKYIFRISVFSNMKKMPIELIKLLKDFL